MSRSSSNPWSRVEPTRIDRSSCVNAFRTPAMPARIAIATTSATPVLGTVLRAAVSGGFGSTVDLGVRADRFGLLAGISARVVADSTPGARDAFAPCHSVPPRRGGVASLVLFLGLFLGRRCPYVRESCRRRVLPRSWRDDDAHRFLWGRTVRGLHICED